MKKQKKKCSHNKTERHYHGRKNYPFGKSSKPVSVGLKKVTVHCSNCGKILTSWRTTR